MRKIRILLVLISCILLLTGCWDKVEIEDRAFVLSIGVDKAKGSGEDSEDSEDGSQDKYLFSFVNPDISKAEEGKVNDFVTFSVQAPSYNIGITRLLQRFAQYHTYEHTKVLIFGEELLEDDVLLKSILDAFSRGHQFNSSMYVFMAHGKAADIFKIKPKMQSLLAYYITGITDNEKYAARVGKITLLDFTKQLIDNEGDGVIPSLDPHEDGLTSSYVGVIKDYRHIAHLNGDETKAWKWLNGKAKGGVIEIEEGNISVPLNYSTFNRKINLDKVEKGKIYLTYSLNTEGSTEEYILGDDLLDENKIKSIEVKLEQLIENNCNKFIKKMQEEYKVDILGVREYLSKFHPVIYENIKNDFDQYFQSNIIINVKADVSVRRTGRVK